MTYDVTAVRAHFPALEEGAAHFDGPGGSQTPRAVGEAVSRTLLSAIANRGTITPAERRAEQIVHDCRAALGDLLRTDPQGIVFGRSMSALTYDVARAMAKTWQPGDEIVVTRLDHDANIRPWVQAAAGAGALVRWADFDPTTGELVPDDIATHLCDRTRVVAVTAAGNLIGTRPDIPAIARLVRGRTSALVYVDGVHETAHESVDVPASGADFWACSPYKFLGPHCGVVAAAPHRWEELHPDKLLPSSDAIPERFELGTLPYELMAGTTAAVDFLASLSPAAAGSRRDRLVAAMASIRPTEALRRRLEGDPAGSARRQGLFQRPPPDASLLFTVEDGRPEPQELPSRAATSTPGQQLLCPQILAAPRSRDAGGVRVGLALTNDERRRPPARRPWWLLLAPGATYERLLGMTSRSRSHHRLLDRHQRASAELLLKAGYTVYATARQVETLTGLADADAHAVPRRHRREPRWSAAVG